MARIRSSIGIKAFLACLLIGIFTWIAGSMVLFYLAKASLRRQLRLGVMSIASTATTTIDPAMHESIHTKRDETSREYKTIKRSLARIRDANPGIRYIYTMRTSPNPNVWTFVVDAEENPKNISHVGDTFSIAKYPQMRKALKHASADIDPTTDKWGTWLSGYAPIRDKHGRAIGIVGVDMSAREVARREAVMSRIVWYSLAIVFVVSTLLSLAMAKVLHRRLTVFIRATRKIRNGDLDFRIESNTEDEIGDFAAAFNRMIIALKQSTRDFLTGLYNHRHFYERIDNEIDRARRHSRPVSLIQLDLDRFKSFNDTFGHQVGDSLLKQLGVLIHESIRNIDVAARVGGDEFAVIAPEITKEQAVILAERLRANVEKHQFYAVPADELSSAPDKNKQIHITITAGIGTYPTDCDERDGLIMAADIALCRGKHVSRNSVYAYDNSEFSSEHLNPKKLYAMLKNPEISAVESLAAAVDAKNRYTYGHSERVTNYALALATAAGLASTDMDLVKIAGLLHDLGKVGVIDDVLNKPGSLTQDEQDIVRQHPEVAADILKKNPELERVIPAIIAHHERWDGQGYPNKLAGEDIPLLARILAIADAFDAMTTDRPYRKAMSVDAALLEMRSNAGKQFDPELVENFIAHMTKGISRAAA